MSSVLTKKYHVCILEIHPFVSFCCLHAHAGLLPVMIVCVIFEGLRPIVAACRAILYYIFKASVQ